MAEILLPSASADVRGHPRHVWAEDGRWGQVEYEEKQKNRPKWKTPGRDARNIASVSLRQPPWTSVDIRGMYGRKMEDGCREIMRKTVKTWPKWKQPGRDGPNIATACFRQLPLTSVDIRGMCGRKMEDVKL